MNATAIAAAFWSAIAATVSAIAALVALTVNRASLRQSVKPELQLLDWSRSTVQRGESSIDTIRIATLKNVGRGVAMHVHANIEGNVRRKVVPLAFMSTMMLPLLAPGESHTVELDIALMWKNVKEAKAGKALHLTLVLFCWDTVNRRHKTTFDFLVIEKPDAWIGQVFAPGIALTQRATSSRSVRALQLQQLVSRVPGLGRIAPK